LLSDLALSLIQSMKRTARPSRLFSQITLKNVNDIAVATTETDAAGDYIFIEVAPGNYTVMEENDPLFPIDVSDYDTEVDGDEFDGDTTVDNAVKVTLKQAEIDAGNNFVDSNMGSISGNVTDGAAVLSQKSLSH
jgi:hypothetical protein